MRKTILLIASTAMTVLASAQTPSYPATFFRFPTDTMTPDIPKGALVVIEPDTGGIKRGDIIAYASTASKAQFIKRVVAIPGDRIENSPQGLKINGKSHPGFERNGTSGSSLWGTETFPPLGQTLTVESDHLYVLSNSALDMLDSRNTGTISIDRVKGKVYLWLDVLKVEGWPKVFLSRSISNIKGLLPKEIEEGFLLEDLSIKGDRTMHSHVRLNKTMDVDARGVMLDQFVQSRKSAYCNGSFEPTLFGVSASYTIVSNTGHSIIDFGFTPKSCP
ncbi:MAG: signal peptidase I [Rhodoferax sp.]|nr:signal peptidase I [Rhodoferax sp.]